MRRSRRPVFVCHVLIYGCRRLKYLNCETANAPHTTLACCILHNFIQRAEREPNSRSAVMPQRQGDAPEHRDPTDADLTRRDLDDDGGMYDPQGMCPQDDLDGGKRLLASITEWCADVHAYRNGAPVGRS